MDQRQARLEAAASLIEIQQLAVRYAQAIDARNLDALVDLWVPDVWMGKAHGAGPDAVRSYFEPMLQRFYRSIHMIVGHRVDLIDADRARGEVYCRAEHESGRDWIVQAIVYDDEYRRVEAGWRFAKRRHHHWYSSPIDLAPTPPGFEHWPGLGGPPPDLPQLWPSWQSFWERAGRDRVSGVTGAPAAPVEVPGVRTLSPGDRLEIHELAVRYGTVIDDRDWPGLARVFTEDALFVTTGFPDSELRLDGLAAIQDHMRGARHPVAHHVTNVIVNSGSDGVTMRSKIIGSGPRGRVGSADYRDRLRLTSEGWRLAERRVALRKLELPASGT